MSEITLEDRIVMYIDVTRWVGEAEDDDERQRLRELACDYLSQAQAESNRISDLLRTTLRDDVQQYLAKASEHPARPLSGEEAEAVRAAHAVPFAWVLEKLKHRDLVHLADVFEGWSLDARVGSIDIALLHGWADNFRMLAKSAGTDWKPPDATGQSLHEFMAKMTRLRR